MTSLLHHGISRLCLGLALMAGLLCSSVFAQPKEGAKVKEGDSAPTTELAATQINKVLPDKKDAKTMSLGDFKGKKNVVLFFYPKAMTPGCTVESCGFSDRTEQFAKLDTVLIGISTDKLEDQQKFTDKEKLKTPLFADPEKKLTGAFGVLSPSGYAERKTFVIDKKGIVRKVYDKVTPGKHPDEVMEYVKETLQKS